MTTLIGREADVAAVVRLMVEERVRLLTLTGPGGVGKTRLAVDVAEETAPWFRDGVIFVPLATVRDPDLVIPTIAHALDVRESFERPQRESLAAALRDRQILLVLDNFEHLLAAAGDLGHLLATCPDLTFLVTSRAALQLDEERRFATLPLAMPDLGGRFSTETLLDFAAITLFVERASWTRRGFALDEANADAVVEICRRLDALPLAIELAAAWIRVLPPAYLLERLSQRLPLLRGGDEDQPARLRTMRDAIAWSYDFLAPAEARLLRLLSIFVGGFTLDGLEAVAGSLLSDGSTDVLDLLAGLIDKSLLQLQTDGPDPRYLMLETVREFTLEQLMASDDYAAVAAAHGRAMAAFAERAEPHLLGPEEIPWRLRCDAELGNIRAALAWTLAHDNEVALRIAAPLWLYWNWSLVVEGLHWMTAAVERASHEAVLVRARGLTTHGALAALCGDENTCARSGAEAVRLAVAAGQPVAEGMARWVEACSHYYDGTIASAAPKLDQAIPLMDLATTSTVRAQAALARAHRGLAAFATGDTAGGIACYEDALARARATGSNAMTMLLLGDLAGWLVDLGDLTRAQSMAQEALLLADGHSNWLLGAPLSTLALVAAIEDDAESAAHYMGGLETAHHYSGLEIPFHFQHRLDRAAILAKSALGEDAFAIALADGRANLPGVLAKAQGLPGALCSGGMSRPNTFGLTARELEVLAHIVAGRSDKEIAVALGVSRRTASNHVASLRAKLDVPSRSAMAAKAVRGGLI